MVQKILFATNRQQTGVQGGIPQLNDVPLKPEEPFLCAAATVDGIDPMDQDSGKITAVSPLSKGAFAEADLAAFLASANDVVVFIHGAMNGFPESIARAAYNQAWLAQTAVKGVKHSYDMITFSWPGRSDYQLAGPFALWNGVASYKHDRSSAGHSDVHVAGFIKLLYDLKARIGTRKMHLLVHSMGVYALGGGVEHWFADPSGPTQPLFDEILLAAGDEESSTFTEPKGRRLSNLRQLGREITVYFNRNDAAMHLSSIVNHAFHLGYEGPPSKANLKIFPPKVFEFVNCIGLKDYIDTPAHPIKVDHTHQYYRESPTVRADIAANLAGLVPERPFFYLHENFHAFKKVDMSGQD